MVKSVTKKFSLQKKNFAVEETFNKQNNRVYSWSSKEACKLVPRIKRGHYPVLWGVSYDDITSLHLCEKGIKTVARIYQRDILINVVEPLNQICSKIDHGYSKRTLHLRIRPKLRNSGLKIMYPNLLVVTIGRQAASSDLNPLYYKLWSVLKSIDCISRHHNQE